MMHIIKTFFDRLLVGVFSGSRKPGTFNKKKPVVPDPPPTNSREDKKAHKKEQKKYTSKKRKYDASKAEHADAIEAFENCLFDKDAQKIVDERVKNLVGYPNWIKASLVQSTQYIIGFIHKIEILLENP